MNTPTTRRSALALLAAAVGLPTTTVHAQTYPAKPITMIVPYPAGGGTDAVARVLAEKMGPKLGQNILVDNKSGAAGILGTDAVAKAAPDGYTLVLSIVSSLMLNQFLFKKLPYNPQKDLAMVSQVAEVPIVLLVRPEVPAKNLDELKKYITANKGKLAYGSFGIGSTAHLFGSELSQSLGADMIHIPYKGEAPMITELLGGQIQLTFASGQQAKPFVDSGKLRAIAVTGEKRLGAFPNVPTMAEQGMTDDVFKAVGWFAIAAPAGTPKAVQQRIADEVRAALKLPDVKAKIESFGYVPTGLGPEELTALYKKQMPVWQKAVKDSGATLD